MEMNAESVLDALNDFERKPSEIPPILEDYLLRVAQNGEIVFPWGKLKPLLKKKLEIVLDEFYETCPVEITVPVPNFETFNYDSLKKTILMAVEAFTSAPFTIQRICELITNPKKHYNRTDKYMRGIEKNVLVVSTIEPRLGVQNDANANVNPIVNGMIGDSPHDDNDCFNGHENNENEPSNNLNNSANHVLLDNFANVFPSAACIPSPSNICTNSNGDSVVNREIDANFIPSTECVESQEFGFEPQVTMDSENSDESKDEQMDTTTEEHRDDTPSETFEIAADESETEPNDPIDQLVPKCEEPEQQVSKVVPEESIAVPVNIENASESAVSESDTLEGIDDDDDVSASDNVKNEADSTPSESINADAESSNPVDEQLPETTQHCQQDDTVSQSDDNVDASEASQSDEVSTDTCEAKSNEETNNSVEEDRVEEVTQSVEGSSDSSGQCMELESSTDEPSV